MVVQKSRNLGEAGPGAGPGSVTAAKVRRGDIRHAIVVRTAKKVQRKDGMVVKFDDNACALIGKNGEPIGTRINGKPPSIPGVCVWARNEPYYNSSGFGDIVISC